MTVRAKSVSVVAWLSGLFLFVLFAMPGEAFNSGPNFLPLNEAFHISGTVPNPHIIQVHFTIAKGYHLYRDKIHFASKAATLGPITLPAGVEKNNAVLGKLRVFETSFDVKIPLINASTNPFNLTVRYQGCAEAGFCYPPEQIVLKLSAPITAATANTTDEAVIMPAAITTTTVAASHDMNLFENHSMVYTLMAFLGFGLLLAFTPCVLPLIPVLSSLIVGQHDSTRGRDFLLSLTFVLAMASGYAIAGILAGYLGYTLQSLLQSPWALVAMSSLFVILALSLFDFYELKLPGAHRIHAVSQRQRGGTYVGVAIMGALSILVVSPCIAPPLAGALTYIGKTGDIWLGGTALFLLGLGMGLPLLAIGLFGDQFLPTAGPWMNTLKTIFGVFLLAIAIDLLSRILPGFVSLVLWGILCIITAVYMVIPKLPFTQFKRFTQGVGAVLFIYGALLLVGASLGHDDPWQPLRSTSTGQPAVSNSIVSAIPAAATFSVVRSLPELTTALNKAQRANKLALVDFYADWCVNCVAMEKNTFPHPELQALLQSFTLIRADVTANNDASRAMQKKFGVFAPPTLLFFTADGKEQTDARLIGLVSAGELRSHLQQLHPGLVRRNDLSPEDEKNKAMKPTFAILHSISLSDDPTLT
jgi:thioredoxin:protein disulfide reductase